MAKIWKRISRYKWWIMGVITILVGIESVVLLSASKPQQNAVGQIVVVQRGDVLEMVAATGTIKPVNMVDVSSKISGRIEEVKVAENDHVNAGQVLMVLDDGHLQDQVTQAQARLSQAASDYQRNARLHQIGAVSDQQLDANSTAYRVAQATYDDTMSQLNDTVIKAPIDGVVIGKPIPAGQTVAPGISSPMVLLTIADKSKMQIETQVDESDIGKVVVGQKVTFTVDAYPDKTFSGVVSNVSDKANIQQNVVYYSVVVDVTSPSGTLKPTMTARVSIVAGESDRTLVVPVAAVKKNNDQKYVLVNKNGQTQKNIVTTGLQSDEQVEILSGLAEGDQVVVPQAKAQQQDNAKSGGAGGAGSGVNVFRSLGH